MGLDTSHDAFHGAYSAFNRFRQAIAEACGVAFPPHYVIDESGQMMVDPATGLTKRKPDHDERFIYWPDDFTKTNPGLAAFITHSDCDGEIAPDVCALIANEMEAILDRLPKWPDAGHIAARGGMRKVAEIFIAGCRAAASANEPLDFH